MVGHLFTALVIVHSGLYGGSSVYSSCHCAQWVVLWVICLQLLSLSTMGCIVGHLFTALVNEPLLFQCSLSLLIEFSVLFAVYLIVWWLFSLVSNTCHCCMGVVVVVVAIEEIECYRHRISIAMFQPLGHTSSQCGTRRHFFLMASAAFLPMTWTWKR